MPRRVDWLARTEDGKFIVPDKEGFVETVQEMFGAVDQTLSLTVAKSTRSSRQNRMMWGVYYRAISDYTGYLPEEIHEICKHKFLKHSAVKLGETEYDVVVSSATIPRDEFTQYMENVRQWGIELGCLMPEPEQ